MTVEFFDFSPAGKLINVESVPARERADWSERPYRRRTVESVQMKTGPDRRSRAMSSGSVLNRPAPTAIR
jgi:hypothetical protein